MDPSNVRVGFDVAGELQIVLYGLKIYTFIAREDRIKGSKNEPLYEGDYSCSFILTE